MRPPQTLWKLLAVILAALSGAAATACSPDAVPTGATPTVSESPQLLVGGGASTRRLLRCEPSKRYRSDVVIGPSGGTIRVGPHSLKIPAGALSARTRIEAVVPAGPYREIDFKPDGLQFAVPAELVMNYKGCDYIREADVTIVYVANDYTILEVLPASFLTGYKLRSPLNHFSKYMLAE